MILPPKIFLMNINSRGYLLKINPNIPLIAHNPRPIPAVLYDVTKPNSSS